MEPEEKFDPAKFGIKSPEEKQKELDRENVLWKGVLLDPDNEKNHLEYVGHVLRTGLLKEASRRYGPIIEDKKYSIEARRFARFYQKQIVNLMFMVPKDNLIKKKNPALGYIFVFLIVMVLLTGIMSPDFWILIPIGVVSLGGYMAIKYKQSQKKRPDKVDQTPRP